MHSAFCTRLTSPQTCVYITAAGTIFGTTDVYELGFSYLSFGIFNLNQVYFHLRRELAYLIHFFQCSQLTYQKDKFFHEMRNSPFLIRVQTALNIPPNYLLPYIFSKTISKKNMVGRDLFINSEFLNFIL